MDEPVRRAAIMTLPSNVRMALLAFMESAAASTDGAPARTARVDWKRHKSLGSSAHPRPSCSSGVMTICRAGRTKYKVRVHFRSLTLCTREQVDLGAAVRDLAILERVKVAATSADRSLWLDAHAAYRTCKAALVASGTSESDLGLSATVNLRGGRWLGGERVALPSMGLREALEARLRLSSARAVSWEALRSEWASLLQWHVHGVRGRRCTPLALQELVAQRTAKVDAARSRILKRRLSQAVAKVERSVRTRRSPQVGSSNDGTGAGTSSRQLLLVDGSSSRCGTGSAVKGGQRSQ